MKSLIITVFNIILFGALAFSCSEDGKKSSPSKPVFKLKDNTVLYSLEGSNLLLLDEDVAEDFGYRNYVVTDGEHIDGERGDELGDYTDATYIIFIQLAVRESFVPADYIQHTSWSSQPGDFYSYLYCTSINEASFYTGNEDRSPIKISGGFDHGEIMKIEFTGELMYSRFDPATESVITTSEEVVLFFEGTIDDRR